jgi:hypothetical protein
MPLLRPSTLAVGAHTVSRITIAQNASSASPPCTCTSIAHSSRQLSTTPLRAAADHAHHEDHYDPPTGWLWGVKPGEKYQKEGWEGVFVWGFFGSLALGVAAYAFKPDTSYVPFLLLALSGSLPGLPVWEEWVLGMPVGRCRGWRRDWFEA